MSVIGYFSHSAVKAFAADLVKQLARELPAESVEKRRKLLSVNKVTRLLDRTYQAAGDFGREHRVGFIKRAVLANTFKWGLKTEGYPDDFVDMATEGLVVALSRRTDKPASSN